MHLLMYSAKKNMILQGSLLGYSADVTGSQFYYFVFISVSGKLLLNWFFICLEYQLFFKII